LLFFSGSLHGQFAARLAVIYDQHRMPEYVLGHHLKGEAARLGVDVGITGSNADPNWWTQTIAFTAVHGLRPGA